MTLHHEFVIPSWAVPAAGEAHLEPVCETMDSYQPIDLTLERVYCVGRSPSNDIPLYHPTSSRSHALIFHHPCGACYLVDLHSAHGTCVNGHYIPPNTLIRIRRGSLVRFGGPGAASFILKNFSSNIQRMVCELGNVAGALRGAPPSCPEVHMLERHVRQRGVACVKGDGGMACIVDEEDAPDAALVLLNTRLNACGGLKALSPLGCKHARIAKAQFVAEASWKKRAREEVVIDCSQKRFRADQLARPIRSVLSKDATFSEFSRSTMTTQQAQKKRVAFCELKPQAFYPPAVTPDELSSDSECEEDDQVALLAPVNVTTRG